MDHCRNETDEEFESKILVGFLGNLRRFDLRTLENKPMMAKARRRIVFGAMETRKFLELGKVKAIIVARNLADDVLLEDDFKYCIDSSVPLIYCLNRKQLGTALLNQTSRIGMVGVLKLDGVHEIWNEILVQVKTLQADWMAKYDKSEFFWSSAYYGHFDLLKRIYESAGNTINVNACCFKTGRTPLMVAVDRDHYNIVEFLINKCGADEDITDFALYRPAHVVKSEAVAKLLKKSLKENAAGLLPIETAIINERIEVLIYWIDGDLVDYDNSRLLFSATRCKSDKSIRFLHRIFKQLDVVNVKGNSLLMESVENGAYEVFKYLIGTGLEIDFIIKNEAGKTILDIAKDVGNVGVSRYLESARRHRKV